MRNHRSRNIARGEPRKARAARIASNAYSVKWASFLVIPWITSRVSGVVLGNSQSTNGPMIRDVFPAEKFPVEANEMNAIQRMSGRYRLIILEGGRSGDDFDDLIGDCRLANAIHVQRQSVDQFARIL